MEGYLLAQKGDEEALAELVRRHMPLVHALSRRFTWQEDAFQAGCIGLVHAIRRFDVSRGVQFSTFAVPHILGEMRRAAYGRESWRTQSLIHRMCEIRDSFLQRHMREPSVQELAERTGCAAAEIALLLERMQSAPQDPDAEIERAPDPASQAWMDRFLLRDLISHLPDAEKRLLYLRYIKNCNQKEAAQLLHTSQASISRLESRACRALRAAWHDMLYPFV